MPILHFALEMLLILCGKARKSVLKVLLKITQNLTLSSCQFWPKMFGYVQIKPLLGICSPCIHFTRYLTSVFIALQCEAFKHLLKLQMHSDKILLYTTLDRNLTHFEYIRHTQQDQQASCQRTFHTKNETQCNSYCSYHAYIYFRFKSNLALFKKRIESYLSFQVQLQLYYAFNESLKAGN